MTQLLFEALNAQTFVMFRKLASDKEQDSQNHLQSDPAFLATLLSLSCMLPI
jgi:hypothetical protein